MRGITKRTSKTSGDTGSDKAHKPNLWSRIIKPQEHGEVRKAASTVNSDMQVSSGIRHAFAMHVLLLPAR